MAQNPKPAHRLEDSMQKAKDVASNVAERTKELGENVSDQAQNMAERGGELASGLGERAGETVSAVGGQMRNLAGTIRAKAPQEGMVGSAASAVANTLESGGSYLEEQSLSDMAEDLSAVIRRYPIASVMIGFGCGLLLARSFRS